MARDVQGWRFLLEEPPSVRPGSSLARDDHAYPDYTASQVAWTGISSAIDSLDLLLTSVTATGRPHATGHRVLARSGLTGASMAAWVLTGPREDRIAHALRAAWDDLSGERAAVQKMKMSEPAGTPLDNYDRILRRLATRQHQLIAAAEHYGLSQRQLRERPTFTEMLDWAVARMPEGDEDDAQAFSFTLGQLNSSVHAARWSSLFTATSVDHTKYGSVVRLQTTASDLFYLSAGGVILTQHALDTFRKRSVEH